MAGLRMLVSVLLASLWAPNLSWAQQFPNTTMFTAYAGLSTECQEALATNVTCSTTLGIISESNGVMTSAEVAAVCIDDCYTSLERARTVIATACTLDTDVIVVQNITFPATFIVDNYLFTYQVSCGKDSLTGEYCDPLIASWSNQTMNTTATSDPGYIYIPTYYPTAPGTLADCVAYRNYTDATNLYFDTPDWIITMLNSCKYIAMANQVTTDQLVEWNPSLSTNVTTCALQPGYSYCVLESEDSVIPEDTGSICASINATEPTTVLNCNCFTYIYGYMSSDYTCEKILADFDLTEAELVAWNPWLAGDCDTELYANITGNDKRAFCIGIDTNATTTTTTSSTSAAPTPIDTVSGCQEFHTVVSGDTCSGIFTEFGITLAQFYAWNPSVGSTCTNLWLDEAYCVKGPATTATTTTTTAAPTQTGIVSNCDEYYTVVDNDSCANIEALYSIKFAELYEWNPAIGSNCGSLWPGYAVCVGVSS